MKTCKDCLHYEACKGTYYTAKGCDNRALCDFDGEMYADIGCEDFTECSEWVHLSDMKWETKVANSMRATGAD